MPGDGIGPYIMKAALLVARKLLKKEIADQRVEFVPIKGMTIEERARQNKSLPPAVLEACKACDILVKGPFVTPPCGRQVAQSPECQQFAAPPAAALCSGPSHSNS